MISSWLYVKIDILNDEFSVFILTRGGNHELGCRVRYIRILMPWRGGQEFHIFVLSNIDWLFHFQMDTSRREENWLHPGLRSFFGAKEILRTVLDSQYMGKGGGAGLRFFCVGYSPMLNVLSHVHFN